MPTKYRYQFLIAGNSPVCICNNLVKVQQRKYNLLIIKQSKQMLKVSSPVRNNNFIPKAWLPSVKTTHDRTTSKKKTKSNPLEFKRSVPQRHIKEFLLPRKSRSQSFQEQIFKLESQKYRYIRKGRYSQAETIDHHIRRAKSEMSKSKVQEVINEQKRQKRSISQAHKREIGYLNQAWNQYFSNLHYRQAQIMQCFRREQQKEIRKSQSKIQKRSRSLNITSRQIIELKQKKQILQQNENYDQLKFVKVQINEAMIRQHQKRCKIVQRFTELEEERLSITQSKKYSVLISRLEQYRKDKEHTYLREQKRLKQKYKNVLQKLNHEQKIQLQQISTMAKLMQY